jgi:hypothetical protein
VSLLFSIKCITSYFTVVPGYERYNGEAKMFSSVVKGSRDKKIRRMYRRI